MSTTQPDTSRAATDVPEFIGELDGGMFERMLSIALSQTGAAVVDHQKKGEVKLTLKFDRIKGTNQVAVSHKLTFAKPTGAGRSIDEAEGATVLFVGRFGKLSLAQPSLLDKATQTSIPGSN